MLQVTTLLCGLVNTKKNDISYTCIPFSVLLLNQKKSLNDRPVFAQPGTATRAPSWRRWWTPELGIGALGAAWSAGRSRSLRCVGLEIGKFIEQFEGVVRCYVLGLGVWFGGRLVGLWDFFLWWSFGAKLWANWLWRSMKWWLPPVCWCFVRSLSLWYEVGSDMQRPQKCVFI